MSKRRHARRWLTGAKLTIPVILLAGALVLAGGSAFAAYRYDRATVALIIPGVRIADVDVGGLSRSQAEDAVGQKARSILRQHMMVAAGNQDFDITPAELGVNAKVAVAVDQAAALTAQYTWLDRVLRRVTDDPVGQSIDLEYVFNQAKVNEFVKKAAATITRPGQDAAILMDGTDGIRFQHAQKGKTLDLPESLQRIRTALRTHETHVKFPLKSVQPEVSDKTLGYTIVIDLSQNKLTLYRGFKVAKTFPVATAQPGFETPVGTWQIVNMVKNPTWINPAPNGWGADSPARIEPGPGNPLGTRAMYL